MLETTEPWPIPPGAPDFQPFWQLSLDLLCIAGFDGYFKRLSNSWTTALGWSTEELMSVPYLDFVHEDDRHATTFVANTLPDGRLVRSFRNRYRTRDGGYRWLQWNAAPDAESGLIYAVAHDVTDQMRIDEARNRLAAALEQAAEAIFITDTVGRITYLNRAFELMTGYSQAESLGHRANLVRSGVHPDSFFADMWRTISTGQIWRGQLHNRRRDGTLYVAKATIAPLRDAAGTITAYVATQQDITGELSLQQQLARSEALEAAGHLVTGVAHDFRNILAAIGAYRTLVTSACQEAGIEEANDELSHLLARGDELTAQLLAFARQDVAKPESTDLNGIVRDTARLLRRTMPPGIRLIEDLGEQPVHAMVVPIRMQQVLLNLALNARDAMPQGGQLRFSCRHTDGGHARLAVADDGCGMTPDVAERIFDPFFTTKRDTGGSGIGLATVAEIVASSAGHIAVDTAPGRGTCFTISLPLVAQPAGG